jgi:hypothetical protein
MFNAPDSAGGKRAKCPTCGGVIQIPSPAPVAEAVAAAPEPAARFADDEFDVEPPASLPADPAATPSGDRKRCPMCGEMIATSAIKCRFCGEVLDKSMQGLLLGSGDASDPAWRKVRSGLAMIYYCIVTIVLVAIVIAIGAVAVSAVVGGGGGGEPPMPAIIVLSLGGMVIIGAAIGILVGQALCASVPQHSGARGFAVGAIICVVLNFALSFISGATGIEALSGIAGLISIVGNILFVLFIRQAARYLGNQQLADSAVKFLIFAVALFGGAIAIGVAAALLPPVAAILGIAIGIGGLIMFVWFLRLLRSLMATIDAR